MYVLNYIKMYVKIISDILLWLKFINHFQLCILKEKQIFL